MGSLSLSPDASIQEAYEPDLLGGTLTLQMNGFRILEEGWDGETLYRPYAIAKTAQKLKAIPYCLWNNRGPGEMTVWIHMAYS